MTRSELVALLVEHGCPNHAIDTAAGWLPAEPTSHQVDRAIAVAVAVHQFPEPADN